MYALLQCTGLGLNDIQALLQDGALDGYSVEELQQILGMSPDDASDTAQTPAPLNVASNGKCHQNCNSQKHRVGRVLLSAAACSQALTARTNLHKSK